MCCNSICVNTYVLIHTGEKGERERKTKYTGPYKFMNITEEDFGSITFAELRTYHDF